MEWFRLPFGEWVRAFVTFLTDVFGWFFDGVTDVLDPLYDGLDWLLETPPFWVVIIAIAALAFWVRGVGLAAGTALGLLFIVAVGQWKYAMDSLALVLVAATIAVVIALPIGIWAARSDRVSAVVRPILDFLQTMPAFVYLIPAIILLGVGVVPGIAATIAFALAPGVRLTELGIRGVDKEVVEAGFAFGASPARVLRQIQLPLAMPSIMAGVNQVIMLSLSMVVISGFVGAGGLGGQIVTSLGRIDVGLGAEAGMSVVILAMILDRMTGGLASRRRRRATAISSAAQKADAVEPRPLSAAGTPA